MMLSKIVPFNLLIREFELEELQKNSIQLVQLLYASILQHHCISKQSVRDMHMVKERERQRKISLACFRT